MSIGMTIHSANIQLRSVCPENGNHLLLHLLRSGNVAIELSLFVDNKKEWATLSRAFELTPDFQFVFNGPAGTEFFEGDKGKRALDAAVEKALDNPDTMA